MELLLLFIGGILFTGLLFGKLARFVHLPNVTGYLVGGVVFALILKLFKIDDDYNKYKDSIELIPTIALGFIAFSIGTEFKFSYFKVVGIKPIIIAIFESIGAVIFVLVGLLILHFINPNIVSIPVAMMLAAIASATAPAATIMVIKQYKAKGEVTSNLLSVVALDDAVALMLFGIMFAIANTVSNHNNSNVVFSIFKPFLEVIASLGVGFAVGFLITVLLKWFTGRGNRLTVVLALILIVSSLEAIIRENLHWDFSFSTLLACMMMGAVFTNTNPTEKVNTVMELVDRFTPPILLMFFVISGADLDLASIKEVGLIGIIYIIARVIGKVVGASIGGVATKSSPEVKKYLGWALVPQAGVAIGLSLVAMNALGADDPHASAIRTVVLCATLIYELTGPLLTKMALKKAGEIQTVDKPKEIKTQVQ